MKNDKRAVSKLRRYLKAPIRLMCKARDLYVSSLTECSGRIYYGAVIGCPAFVVYTLPPESCGMHPNMAKGNQDVRELMKEFSMRPVNGDKGAKVGDSKSKAWLAKSLSVGIGRIDEDKPCFFPEDFEVDFNRLLYKRNRSCAITSKKKI